MIKACVCLYIYIHVCDITLSPASFLSLLQSAVPQPTFSMPVTVPVSNQNAALQFSNNPGGALVTTTSFLTSALTDPRLLSPQQPTLHRNTVSPGLPQRPASAGKRHPWCRSFCGIMQLFQESLFAVPQSFLFCIYSFMHFETFLS